MYLWTEFEGATIDSAFALTKLLQTEGRSAFFSTLNASGESVLIRIIECHFDEDEILARWRGIQALGHPNFLRIDRFGQFLIEGDDGVTAVYVVFERVEANLGEVLERGCLSTTDATQIGLSVSSALETLHANGFIHEHIETRNIYAVGDIVKLRSDCIRESPEGEAGIEARRRDVHALAVVLMQVLLGTSSGSSAPYQPLLPAPFDDIVRNGMNGTWGLAEIKAALGRRDVVNPKKTGRLDVLHRNGGQTITPVVSADEKVTAVPVVNEQRARPEMQFEQPELPFANSEIDADFSRRKKEPMELPVIFGISERDFRSWVVAVAMLLGVVLVGWGFLHYWFGRGSASASRPASSVSAIVGMQPPGTAPEAKPSAIQAGRNAGSHARVDWRVVAFTYSRQDQAQKKASSLAQQYPTLLPAAFSPNGKAPWLVTVGGVLDRDAAYALARRAQSLGLPRDTYAQDYKVR